MRERVLGTVTIGQAPRPDVVPIIDRYVAPQVRRIDRGVLDGLSRAQIDSRYKPEPGEPVPVTRLQDGCAVELSRARMRGGVQDRVAMLENDGCDVILLLCTGMFEGLECRRAWLIGAGPSDPAAGHQPHRTAAARHYRADRIANRVRKQQVAFSGLPTNLRRRQPL